MSTIKTQDGVEIFYRDWGPRDRGARSIVFHHGWPLSGDDWEAQMFFFLQKGFRVIAHDRRGHGRSTPTPYGNDMDTYAADVAALVSHLGLRDAIHIGHSTGGGEATRYVARYGKGNVAKLILLGAVPPLLVRSPRSSNGVPMEVFDGVRAGVAGGRAAYYWDFTIPFYGFNREGAVVSEAVRLNWWRQAMMGGALPQYECVKAFSETDFTEDLRAIEVPVFFLHGDDDQIVPITASAQIAVKLVKHGVLKTYEGLPHGMATTHAERINTDMLSLLGDAVADVRGERLKVVVIGGTGLIGSKLVSVLRQRGHDVVAAAPASGINTLTGEGLPEVLAGADVVVDVANSPSFDDEAAMKFFVTSGRNLLAAEKAAGIRHHVALSVVGAHRVVESGYLRAKAAQEDLIRAASLPFTIVESTQFFEFIERVAKAALDRDVYRLSPALMQPIAADDVVVALADAVLGAPRNDIVEIAGPETMALDELGREVLSAHEDHRQVVADAHARYYGAELNDQSLIPGPGAQLGTVRFGDWLRRSMAAE